MTGAEPLLSVEGLSVAFTLAGKPQRAVDEVSFDLHAGRTLALLGESGSGKSLTALALLALLEPPALVVAGRISFKGEDLCSARSARMQELRGNRLAMVFQEPMSALNPVQRVGEQVAEPLRVHCGTSRPAAQNKALDLLSEVGLPNPKQTAAAYPHQLSGGMRQRVMIAMALACGPDVLIADEPTTALDVTTQAQILSLLRRLQRHRQMALLFITHDLSLLSGIADHVAVIYAGRIVERSGLPRFVGQPAHPYTDALKRSLPSSDPDQRLAVIPGQVPALAEVPAGCAFAPRCPRAQNRCRDQRPELTAGVACFYPLSSGC